MKTILIVLLSLVVLSVNAKDKPEEIGFLISTRTFENGLDCQKVFYIEVAEMFLNKIYSETCVDLKFELKKSNVFQIQSETKSFYIERKRMVLKRNGEWKFKSISKRNSEKYWGKL